MRKEGLFLKEFLLLFIFICYSLIIVSGEPYINNDCSDAEIKKVWDSVFKESFNDENIIKNGIENCSYLIVKNSPQESFILIGDNLVSIENEMEIKETVMKMFYVNGSVDESIINEEINESNLIIFATEKNINDNVEAEQEFNKIFKDVSSGNWNLVKYNNSLNYYKSSRSEVGNFLVKSVFEKLGINILYYNFIENISENSTTNESNLSFSKDIDDIFVDKEKEFTINIKIYLKNPENLENLSYKITGAKNASISFKGDLMVIKWDKNYDGIEEVRLYVSDENKEIRSNKFLILSKEEGELYDGDDVLDYNPPTSPTNDSKEELSTEKESFNWLILIIIISSILALVIILVLIYFLFLKKEKIEEDFSSPQVDEYIKELKIE